MFIFYLYNNYVLGPQFPYECKELLFRQVSILENQQVKDHSTL